MHLVYNLLARKCCFCIFVECVTTIWKVLCVNASIGQIKNRKLDNSIFDINGLLAGNVKSRDPSAF